MEHELNARPLGNKEVGNKFVLHPEFSDLVSLKNTIVVGPRGSGKTTMLKMLTPEALHYWSADTKEASEIKSSIRFIGLYVPMSRIFQDDLEFRFKQSNLSLEKKTNLLYKIYFLNILESVIELVHFFIKRNNVPEQQQIIISSKFNEFLNLEIKHCYKISSVASKIAQEKLFSRRQFRTEDYVEKINYSGEIISNLEPVLKLVNEIFDLDPEQKYALCLDELDVYVSAFTAEMIKNLRGISTNIILKLTLAPIHSVTINDFMDPPSQVHDFDRIYLWPSPEITKKTRYDEESRFLDFSEKLAKQTFKELINQEVDIDVLLGSYSYRAILNHLKSSESEINAFRNIDVNNMNDEEIETFIYKLYASQNPLFKKYLESVLKRKISKLSTASRLEKSEVIRKIKQIIFNRVVTTKIDKTGLIKFKQQKVLYQYHGKKIVLKVMDGNPRYLKKLVEYLAEYIEYDHNGTNKSIKISNQARSLMKVKDLFIQRINSIPLDNNNQKFAAGKLIKDIGNYISQEQNLKNNWSTSFPSYVSIPDKSFVSVYEETFRKAINHGALLIIDDSSLDKLNTVKQKSIRLNYLLHIEFRIPIRKYYPVSFEKVIGEQNLHNTLFQND